MERRRRCPERTIKVIMFLLDGSIPYPFVAASTLLKMNTYVTGITIKQLILPVIFSPPPPAILHYDKTT